nr:ribonuclease H-like domain-containing protein [Tanacetum cinerariifolium]
LDDAKEIWLAMKARFGGNEESKKIRKTMLKQDFSEFRVSEEEGLHKGYDRFKSDFIDPAVNAAGSVYDAAAEFAMMGISPKAMIEKKEWEVKLVESLARFDKWKASSKNLAKLINSSMTTRTKLGLGFKEYFGSDEVFDLSTPSIFDPELVTREVKSLYERFIKAGDTYEVPPSITGTFMPTSSNFVLEETQDCHVYDTVDNFTSVVLKAASVPAGSRNSLASASAGRSIPTASRNRSASIYAGRSIPAASRNRSASIYAGRFILAASINRLASIHASRSIPAASRNRSASIHAGRHIPAGRDDEILLLSPQQVVLEEITDLTCNGVPRTMVHPYVNKDIGIVNSGCSRSMTGNKDKLDDFVQVKGGTVTFGGGD